MNKNKFKNLYEKEMGEFVQNKAPQIEKKIKSNLSFLHLFANLIELFLPRQSQTYMKMLSNKDFSAPGATPSNPKTEVKTDSNKFPH
ncbi:MAG TPA: hypothetical protein PKD32_01655 [Saprospiraceae bacterium]|jgi:hypothetical protein|nr:hypothetical protein [Saprospiraceae bacterium]HMS28532.1 hypothetical protein [Saprospiraceae bacterium]